jgi:hypothetical protein
MVFTPENCWKKKIPMVMMSGALNQGFRISADDALVLDDTVTSSSKSASVFFYHIGIFQFKNDLFTLLPSVFTDQPPGCFGQKNIPISKTAAGTKPTRNIHRQLSLLLSFDSQ